MNTDKNSKSVTANSEKLTQSHQSRPVDAHHSVRKISHENSSDKGKPVVIGILTTKRLHSGRIKPRGVQGELSFLFFQSMSEGYPVRFMCFTPGT